MFQPLAAIQDIDKFVGFSEPLRGKELLHNICVRLERELPGGPYLSDRELATLLGLTVKTLCNRRALKTHSYPVPFKIANCRDGKHVRSEIVSWLAQQEMTARANIVHRCR